MEQMIQKLTNDLPEPYNEVYFEVFKQKMKLVKMVLSSDLSADEKYRLVKNLDAVMQHLMTVIGYIREDIEK